MQQKIGMVVALASEARMLLGPGSWHREKDIAFRRMHLDGGLELIVTRVGVGPENASSASRWLISKGVTGLAGIGFAGGLFPGLKAGDLVIAKAVSYLNHNHTSGPWKANAVHVNAFLSALIAEGIFAHCGHIVTSPQAVLTAKSKTKLFHQTQALAVDMESAAIAQNAAKADIACIILRAICDPADYNVPQALYACLDKNGKIQWATLMMNLVRKPSLVKKLHRMARQFAAARAALRRGGQILIKHNLWI